MKLFSKIIAGCLVGLQLSSPALAYHTPNSTTTAYSPLSGVTVRINQTLSDGEFLSYQVVECDLSNPNLSLDIMYPKEGASTLQPTKKIGEENGAKVVLNADYFNRSSESQKGSAVGYNEKDGVLLSNALEEQVYSFSYNQDHQYSFDVYSNQIKIGFRNEVFEFVKTYNKYSSLEGIAIFDKHWGKESLGSHGTLVELVIENGILTDIRRDMPPAVIPENGYVVAGLSDLTTLFDQIQVGDAVTLEIITTPTLEFLPDFAVGGGSLLVSEGKIPEKMSYPKYSDSFPALAISQDGKTIWLITAVNQTGLTQKKMAELCLKEGAYYAVSFDGGGSTQCAVVDNTTGELAYIHSLAGGYERPVANAIGVKAEAENPGAYGIRTQNAVTYPNIPKEVTYIVYDELGTPMEVPKNQVTISVKEGKGTVKDGFFYGEAMTAATLLVKYKDISGEVTYTTVAPATHAQKTKNNTYQVTNPDGYTREISENEYQKATGLVLSDTLPKNDIMAENIGLSHSLSLYGGMRNYTTFFNRLLTKNILERMKGSMYPFSVETTPNEKIEIATIDNSQKSIVKKGMAEWNRLSEVLNTDKKNILLLMKEPLSFSRSEEEALFFDALSQTRFAGKNILVVYRGEKTELVTFRDGVRVLSLAYDASTPATFLTSPTEYLKIHYNDTQMTYEIISDSFFLIP